MNMSIRSAHTQSTVISSISDMFTIIARIMFGHGSLPHFLKVLILARNQVATYCTLSVFEKCNHVSKGRECAFKSETLCTLSLPLRF